jgi:pilus assembly protein TadC
MVARRRGWIAGIAAVAIGWYAWGLVPVAALAGPVAGAALWVGLGRAETAAIRRRRVETLHALPEALDLMEACVRAGGPLRNAVDTVARALGPPIAPLFGTVANALSVGLTDGEAWLVLGDDPVAGPVARDLARSTAWGTTITDVLSAHAVDVRRQGTAERLAAAKAVGVKSVLPLGVCYLPAFILLGVVPFVASGLSGVFG